MRHNPWIADVLAAESYRDAFIAVERWQNATPEQRKGMEEPSGPWVKRVHEHRHRSMMEQFEERDDALRTEGRA